MNTAGAVRRSARLALAPALGASALLAAAGHEGGLAFAVWLAGCFAVALAWYEPRRAPGPSRREWIGLLGVTALGALFRLHQIYDLPYGFPIDEARVAERAAAMFPAHPFAPFANTPLIPSRPDYVRLPNLYLYFCAGVQWLGGGGRFGAKLISVLPGIAAVPLLYACARAWLRPPFALLAAGFLAVSTWHVGLSRWGWEQVLTTALCVSAFGCVVGALGGLRLASAAWAGLLSGLSLYADESARLALAAAAGLFGLELALRRDAFAARALASFALGALAAALPLFAGWLREPSLFGARLGEVWIGPALADGDLAPLLRSVRAHLGMFHFAGDPNPRHNPAGGPMLHPVTGTLFALGVGLALARLRTVDARVCLTWLFAGLLGGVLAFSTSIPHAYRTGLVAPACCALAAGAAQWLVERAPPGSCARRLVGAALCGAFALAAVGAWRDLFTGAQQTGAAWKGAGRGAAARSIADVLAERLPPDGVAYLDRRLRRVELRAELLRFRSPWWRALAGGSEGGPALSWLAEDSPEALGFALSQPGATRVYVAAPGAEPHSVSETAREEIRDPSGGRAAWLVVAEPAPAACGLAGRFETGGQRLEALARTPALTGLGRPLPGAFSGEWRGWLEIAQPDRYRFALESDARAALAVSGVVLEVEKPGRVRRREAALDLARGHHPLSLRVEADAASRVLALRFAPREEPWSPLWCGLLRPEPPAGGLRPAAPAPAGSETPR
jgi:hypothetical protein